MWLHARGVAEREAAGQSEVVELANASRVGLVGDDSEARGGEEVLRDGAPQVPQRLDGRVLLTLDERFRIEIEKFAELAQERRRAVQTDRCLQVGLVQVLAELPSELATHADVHVGIDEPADVVEMRAERIDQIDPRTDALDGRDLVQIGR